MTPKTTTWTKTLNHFINWYKTNKLAGGIDMPTIPTPQQDQLTGRVYRILLVVEEEDNRTGDTSELEDYTLVMSAVLPDLGAAGREWERCRDLIDFGKLQEIKP